MDVARRIIEAYPTALAGEAAVVAATMIAQAATLSPKGFRVVVAGQVVTVPERLYVDRLPALKMNGPAVACLLTRHHDGFVRQRALSQILRVNAEWSIPFVVRLAGEYVLEIIAEIEERFAELPSDHIGAFVRANPVRSSEPRLHSAHPSPRDQLLELLLPAHPAPRLCGAAADGPHRGGRLRNLKPALGGGPSGSGRRPPPAPRRLP
jgi:hypothetical protein